MSVSKASPASHLHFSKPWPTCHWLTTPAHSWWSPVSEPHPGLPGKVADCILSAWLCNSQITAYILSSEHVTGCTHELSSHGCVHKIKSANIPAWLREWYIRPPPKSEVLLSFDGYWEKVIFLQGCDHLPVVA